MEVDLAAKAGTVKVGDFTVNRLGFGGMRLTGKGIWGEPANREQCLAVLRMARDVGINFFDTADSYGPEVSENIIAEALKPYNGLIIATKGGKLRPGPDIWHNDCSPEQLRRAIESSLKRLGLKRIDLYQLHAVDIKVDYQKSLQTLIDLKNEGKIRHIGVSNVGPEELEIATKMTNIVSVQNRYNVFERRNEDVLKMCEERGITFIAYFPLGGGKYIREPGQLKIVADKYGATVAQVAIAWLLQKSKLILPIPGTTSLDHLRENLLATELRLDKNDINLLDNL